MTRCNRRTRGFTLIELMIVVAIVAILAAVGYPSYLEHIRKSRRAEAQQTLMNVASKQQQFLLDTRGYTDTFAALRVTVPDSVQSHYSVSVVISASPTFTVTAAPRGSQLADKCGTLQLIETGAKTPSNCW